MKRISSAVIISVLLLAACSDNIPFTPGISFLTPAPEMTEETAIFRVIGQPFSSADSVKVPVVFGGDAERGTDYVASADQFVFTSDSPTDSIVISTRQLGTGKTLVLSLQIPEGFVAGKYIESGFKLQDKYGQLTFDADKGYIADTTEYKVTLKDASGATRALSRNTPLRLEVNQEKSTAVEGEDFGFVGSSELMIAGGSSSASFRIAPAGTSPREGKDKIVLNVIADDRFDTGVFPELELNLIDRELKALEGGWSVDTLVTDSLFFEQIWGAQCSEYSLVPEFNSSDSFQIDFLGCGFTPYFRSGLKNFFTGKSCFTFGGKKDITDTEGNPKQLLLLSLDHTNRYFSETEVSEDSVSFVGIHLTKEPETENDMMEFHFIDHTSKNFMPELESGMKYGSEKPVATEPGTYLMATFRKR